jgi:hypothetical protein
MEGLGETGSVRAGISSSRCWGHGALRPQPRRSQSHCRRSIDAGTGPGYPPVPQTGGVGRGRCPALSGGRSGWGPTVQKCAQSSSRSNTWTNCSPGCRRDNFSLAEVKGHDVIQISVGIGDGKPSLVGQCELLQVGPVPGAKASSMASASARGCWCGPRRRSAPVGANSARRVLSIRSTWIDSQDLVMPPHDGRPEVSVAAPVSRFAWAPLPGSTEARRESERTGSRPRPPAGGHQALVACRPDFGKGRQRRRRRGTIALRPDLPNGVGARGLPAGRRVG